MHYLSITRVNFTGSSDIVKGEFKGMNYETSVLT